MHKPTTDGHSSTRNATTASSGGLPIRSAAHTPATTTANAPNSRAKDPRPPAGSIPPSKSRPLTSLTPQATSNSNNTDPGTLLNGPPPQPARPTQPHTTASGRTIFRDPPGKVWTQSDDTPPAKEFGSPLPETDPLAVQVSDCIDHALRLLKHERGRASLIKAGYLFVKEVGNCHKLAYSDKGYPPEYYGKMGDWVDDFLECVHKDFPNVYVTRTLKRNGSFHPKLRTAGAEKDYKPKDAGYILLDKWIFDNIFYQQNKVKTTNSKNDKEMHTAALEISQFIVTLAVARQMVPLFIRYLSGEARTVTPPNMHPRPSSENESGDSGGWWENELFQGELKSWHDPGNPKNALVVFLKSRHGGEKQMMQIDLQFIKSVLDKNAKPDFSERFDWHSVHSPRTLDQIRGCYREMSKVKEEEDRKLDKLRPRQNHPPGESRAERSLEPIQVDGAMRDVGKWPNDRLKT